VEECEEDELDFVSEEEEDLADAVCPIYDQLKCAPLWWILEVLPQTLRHQNDDDTWTRTLHINLGNGRVIPEAQARSLKVHRTVKLRMEVEEKKKYKPKARWAVEPTWVD
jgi:hypothetical protein